MRDNTTCEEVFEADANARAEFEAVCDEWQKEAMIAQDQENDSEFHPFMKISAERKSQMQEWKTIPENERPTWEQFKRGLKRKKN